MSSNDAANRADQIAHRFFAKFPVVVANARSTDTNTLLQPQSGARTDKWFNLETIETDAYRDQLRLYRSISSRDSIPPLEIQVLLSIPDLSSNQVLVLLDPNSSRTRVEPTPRYILLESWTLSFDHLGEVEVALPTVYKHSISLVRSLFTLLRVLPVWDLFKRLRRRAHAYGGLGIEVIVGDHIDSGVLGFDEPLSPHLPPFPTSTHTFPPVSHPFGSLTMSTTYLSTPMFQIDTMESLMSSRFLAENEFTPTLSKNSLHSASPPGSLPLRTTLPRSPPSHTPSSIADRFVVPRTSPSPTSSLARHVPLPQSEHPSPGLGGASPIQPRPRTESLLSGTGTSTDRSFPSPLPIRRPSSSAAKPLNAFKSSTVSSSPSSTSFRQPSPLASAAGPSLPSRPVISPLSPQLTFPRASPPYMPSSLGDRAERRSLGGGGSSAETGGSLASGTGPGRPGTTKRYSSSFSYRYNTAIGVGSEGSGGSGERREATTSILTEEESNPDIPIPPRERRTSAPVMILALHPISPPTLTSLTQLDDALSQMTRQFENSLEGIGPETFSRRSRSRGSEESSPSRGLGLGLGLAGTGLSPTLAQRRSPNLRATDLPSEVLDYRSRGPPISPSPSFPVDPYPTLGSSPLPIPTGISPRERLGIRRSFDTIASNDDYRGAGSGGSEEIIGRIEIDERPGGPSLHRRW